MIIGTSVLWHTPSTKLRLVWASHQLQLLLRMRWALFWVHGMPRRRLVNKYKTYVQHGHFAYAGKPVHRKWPPLYLEDFTHWRTRHKNVCFPMEPPTFRSQLRCGGSPRWANWRLSWFWLHWPAFSALSIHVLYQTPTPLAIPKKLVYPTDPVGNSWASRTTRRVSRWVSATGGSPSVGDCEPEGRSGLASPAPKHRCARLGAGLLAVES